MKTETRSLFNFFLSSFVCPMLRFWFPQRNRGPLWYGQPLWDTTWGNTSVHILMIGGLSLSWWFQGIDHLFLGFLFLQAIPEIQRRFWMKPEQHICLVVGILVVCLPFYSIGLMAWYFPSYLEMLPKSYLQWLCWLANARPEIPDHYTVLGVSPDADMKTIKKVFREQAIDLHPDKVGDDPIKLARFHAIQAASDALTKGRAEYDKSIENQELNEMVPRCYAFLVMMGYWLLHSLIDWNDVEGMRDQHKDALREHILRKDGPIDLKALGLPDNEGGRETLKKYCETEDVELPFLAGKKDDILLMRTLLEGAGYRLDPFPQVTGLVAEILQEVVLGSKDMTNIKDVNTTPGFYKGYTIEVEAREAKEGESAPRKCSSTIVDYTGGATRIATVNPPLEWRPEKGDKFTLSKGGVPKGKGDLTGLVGYHPLGGVNQIFTLGVAEKKEDLQWELQEVEGYYNGYTMEVRNGKTLVGTQKVFQYWPASKKVVLEAPLRVATGKQLMGDEIRPEVGKSTYTIFPDDLVPRPRIRFAPEGGSEAPQQAQVSAQVMATPKNIVNAPKGAVAATRNVKSKINKHKAYIKKVKGGNSCSVM